MNDSIQQFGRWLATTPLVDLAETFAASRASDRIGANFWVVPILQFLHIFAIAGAFGALLMTVLRIFGRAGMSMNIAETTGGIFRGCGGGC